MIIVHPTQKPIELGRYFVRTYSNPGDVILDNTFGSGSFLVAALMEGRNFIGIEKNEDGYFVSGEFHKAALGDIISNSAIASIIDRNKDTLAQHLYAAAIRDAKMGAFINTWWEEVKTEYEHDEADSYKAYDCFLLGTL